jgi:hypothetical protein
MTTSRSSQIFKYRFHITGGPQKHLMPHGATVVHVGSQVQPSFAEGRQEEWLCLWAIVNPENDKEERKFVVVGTGHPTPPLEKYLGTAQMKSGFVWHLFEDLS